MKTCKCGCGKEIAENKTFVSGHNGRGRRKPISIKECDHCKISFSGTEKFMEKRKFCSNACRDNFRKANTGEKHPSYTSFKMDCQICGAEFVTQPARLKKSQVYCSMECGREGRRRKISGARRKTAPIGKRKAKVRDQFSCRICGFDLAVHVHHIVHRKSGGTNHLSNLITLCPNHHALAHAGLLTADEMAAAISSELPPEQKLRVKAKHCINYRG